MSKKLFVGNIEWGATVDDLRELFSQYGELIADEVDEETGRRKEGAVIVTDKFSGRSKGFGFVTFVNEKDADKAVEALNEYELNGRPLVVNEARPPKPRNDRY